MFFLNKIEKEKKKKKSVSKKIQFFKKKSKFLKSTNLLSKNKCSNWNDHLVMMNCLIIHFWPFIGYATVLLGYWSMQLKDSMWAMFLITWSVLCCDVRQTCLAMVFKLYASICAITHMRWASFGGGCLLPITGQNGLVATLNSQSGVRSDEEVGMFVVANSHCSSDSHQIKICLFNQYFYSKILRS